ncbi:class I SAM-dependent methyltransferase [Saccharopolyspora taberi]|uniref:Class I SAM-dependent methyltransferase n=1 Tax=Saccharopolyspora taberi TaxID=60895 RepID=A0ABN3UZA8_9PSEU
MGIPIWVDESNADQFGSWDGQQGALWAARADRFDAGVAAYRDHFFGAAAIEPDARVLDIGCGNGQTTREAARRATAGSALGVDLSSHMVELARARAREEGVANAEFEQADAQTHAFGEAFDIAISRHGAMFFGDAPAAFANIARSLRPGGRLVLLTWQPLERNEFISTFRRMFAAGRDLPAPPADGPSPFSLSDPARVRELLTGAGFADVTLRAVEEPMWFGDDVEDAFAFVHEQHGGLLNGLSADAAERAVEALKADMAEHRTSRGVEYGSAAWVVTAARV